MSCPYGDDGCQGLHGRRVCMRCAFDTARAMDRENVGDAFEAMRRQGQAPPLSDQISDPDQISDQGHAEPVHAPSKGLRVHPDTSKLATRLQRLTGPALERLLEAVLHQAWDAGWTERDKPEPAPNPYNILARVPEEFLTPAMEIASARAEFLEKNLDTHLFPGLFEPPSRTDTARGSEQLAPVDAVLFKARENLLDEVVCVVHKMRGAPLPAHERQHRDGAIGRCPRCDTPLVNYNERCPTCYPR